jgi:hypothetical protein
MKALRRALVSTLLVLFAPLLYAEKKIEPLLDGVPSGALAFAETSELGALISAIKTSPMYETLIESEQFKEMQETKEYEDFQGGVKLAEFILRTDLWEAGDKLFGGRVGLAFYPGRDGKDPDFVFLLRPSDPSVWTKQRIWTDPLLWFAADRIDKKRYSGGLKAYKIEGDDGPPVFFALHDEWVAVSSKQPLLEKTISLQVTDPKERLLRRLKKVKSLGKDETFLSMAKKVGDDHLLRVMVDVKTISKGTGGRLGLPEKMDNPLGSLLAGGMLELAAHSSEGTITVDTEDHGFAIEVGFDGGPGQLDEPFQVFFSKPPKSGTQPLPDVPGLIGGFTFYRDLATWYRNRDELLIDEVLPEFDKFETGIGNLLPGKDMGEDVLPLLGNNMTFVSALQNYDHLGGEPGVKLPGFALIVDLKEAEEATDIFQLFFQTFLSVLNFDAGNQARQPWLIDLTMHNDIKITTARYLENPQGEDLPVVFNFLPASARVGNKYVISSSLQLCEQLVDVYSKPPSGKLRPENLNFEVRFDPLAKILAANSEHFEAQRVSEGRTVKQAKADVALFLSVLKGLDSFSTTTLANKEGFKVRIEGTLTEGK